MFYINNIRIYNFRNIEQLELKIKSDKIAFVGANGIGKTNILQALYYNTYAKVYRSGVADALNINNGKNEMSVIVDYRLQETDRRAAVELDPKGKRLLLEGQICRSRPDFIKNRNIVLITPDDILIINGGSDQRRNYLDALLSKLSSDYLQQLIVHNKYLKNRNAYLKQSKGKSVDLAYLSTIDLALIPLMQKIHEARKQIFESLESKVNEIYVAIAQKSDKISVQYVSPLELQDAEELIAQTRREDMLRGRTTQGVHRDDIVLSINGSSTKDFASQGQKKTLLFALRLAELEMLGEHIGNKPLLMIDDLFEKLDNARVKNLIERVQDNQLIVTDTDYNRAETMLGKEAQIVALT